MRIGGRVLSLLCFLVLLSCKKDDVDEGYQIDVIVSGFHAESVRVILTDNLESIIYYDRILIDDNRDSRDNMVVDSFAVPKGIPKFLYKMRLEGPANSLATINLNHKFGSVSQGIGGVVTSDPRDTRYWVKGSFQVSVNLQ